MKIFIKEELSCVLGGIWITLPDGTPIYIGNDDEEEKEDDTIFG